MDELSRILRQQDGVVSRRQVLETGATSADVRRMVRRRELAPSPRSAPGRARAVATGSTR